MLSPPLSLVVCVYHNSVQFCFIGSKPDGEVLSKHLHSAHYCNWGDLRSSTLRLAFLNETPFDLCEYASSNLSFRWRHGGGINILQALAVLFAGG